MHRKKTSPLKVKYFCSSQATFNVDLLIQCCLEQNIHFKEACCDQFISCFKPFVWFIWSHHTFPCNYKLWLSSRETTDTGYYRKKPKDTMINEYKGDVHIYVSCILFPDISNHELEQQAQTGPSCLTGVTGTAIVFVWTPSDAKIFKLVKC